MEAEKKQKTHLCTLKTGEKKAQYVPTRPSDTDMHQDNTTFHQNTGHVPTLCES